MAQKQYSLKERADYHAKMAKTGSVDINGKKLSDAQRAGHLVKAGRIQNRMQRVAKSAEYFKKNGFNIK